MKTLIVSIAVIAIAVSSAAAGEVFGTIVEGGKPVPAGVKVEITAGGKVYATETDKFGAYRVFVKEKGKCTLTVHIKEQAPTVELFSYDRSTRYDWILETKDGKLSLGRK